MMLAPVTIGLIGKLMLQGEFGMLTYYLRQLGILGEQSAMLSDPKLAFVAIVVMDIWQWTPFVTLVIGTSSTARSGHRPCHMPRATSPWRALTPLAMREERRASSSGAIQSRSRFSTSRSQAAWSP